MTKALSSYKSTELLSVLEARFKDNMERHKGIEWERVKRRIENDKKKLKILSVMESTGGEPDVVGHNSKTDEYIFYDCSLESPAGRRSLCYDDRSLKERKTNRPEGSAVGMAKTMGIEILSEEEYMGLQKLGMFDTKTSSWIKTPDSIRKLGGALFSDRRYDHVFVYHNGAESYYASRGFRGVVKV